MTTTNSNQPRYSWIADFVYGAIDGSVTTFAVVAGVQGASLSVSIVLILGFANLLSDGLSMAVSKYSGDKADKERIQKIRRLEYQSIKENPEEEIAEIKTILAQTGVTGKTLTEATKMVTANKDKWVDLMLRHEFNVIDEAIYPVRGAVTTFTAFIIVGCIPLIGYVLMFFLPISRNYTFFATCLATLGALFIVGAIKSTFTDQHWFKAGITTMALGGVAASVSYGVGFLLKGIA